MPPLQLLIKPASGNCNMRCDYCFYMDEMENREQESYGFMSLETLEMLVKKALEYADSTCSFIFQGGEPTLVGLEFYQRLMELEKKYNTRKIQIENAIQTNGYGMNDEWAAFFAENRFLVGLSIDGICATHNAHRKDAKGKETFARIMNAAQLLEKHGAQFNILTVVHNKIAQKVSRIYQFYKKNGFRYQQYIACLDPLGAKEKPEYSLSAKAYGQFLIELFELWYLDLQKGEQPYIRQFENYISILLGMEPEACDMRGMCSLQQVIEADGSVYPCDFFVLDEYKIGNIYENDFGQLLEKGIRMNFVQNSVPVEEECRVCKYFPVCRGGCGRHRLDEKGSRKGRNCFCESYQMFFDAELSKMLEIAEKIRRKL